MAHLRNIDLNLLVILECLFRHRNVTSASNELGLTQSAVSHSLVKLREHFKDPLFVRVSRGVAPTEFAQSLRANLEEFVLKAIDLTEKSESFNPKTATGRVTISSTDYIAVLFTSELTRRISKEAPHLQISFRHTLGDLPKSELEDGSYDIAIAGFYKDLPEGFYKQKLFTDTFSTAYRKNHPKLKNGLNKKNYFDLEHILITLQGDFKDSNTKSPFEKNSVRNIKVGSASFTSPAWLISETDLILTGPTLLLFQYQKYFPITVVPCPMDLKPIELEMVWHGLTNQNPLKKWFRQVLKEITSNLS